MMMLIVFSHFEFLQRFDESGFVYQHIFANAFFSVDFFFILSGFGMMYSFVSKNKQIHQISIKGGVGYAIDHVKKLYRLYAVTMLVSIPLYCFYEVNARNIPMESLPLLELKKMVLCIPLLQSSLGLHQYSHAFNGVSWFLSSLFVCYLFSPILLKLLTKIRNASWLYFAIFVNIVMIWPIRNTLRIIENNTVLDDLVYGSPWSRIFYVSLGMLLAQLFIKTKKRLSSKISDLVEIEIVTLCIFFVLLKNTVASNELVIAFISIILCCTLIFIFSFQNGRVSRFLQRGGVTMLGETSMYIFLIHYPIRSYLDTFARFAGFKDSQGVAIVNVIVTLILTLTISLLLRKNSFKELSKC